MPSSQRHSPKPCRPRHMQGTARGCAGLPDASSNLPRSDRLNGSVLQAQTLFSPANLLRGALACPRSIDPFLSSTEFLPTLTQIGPTLFLSVCVCAPSPFGGKSVCVRTPNVAVPLLHGPVRPVILQTLTVNPLKMSQASCNQVVALLGDLLPSTASRICSGTPILPEHFSRAILVLQPMQIDWRPTPNPASCP
ncbi:hypothetical protein COCCADRAFT_30697 [Bipolaris zeicola 26-R-13]|uniref:Uncharacterized protein n=1 Tax=Cochliobolus carbonum (strain 26-R-13) TaxID=930089 RepID=W6XYY7_COCC2|nr:uncharacterized protein COCCADRAFT_30697 [Bipolaris zeicola 26-R-13]EUC27939.1 hypothetical protein COCCADRAFT_30697 [Bipolaris zeicola 26-R-13]